MSLTVMRIWKGIAQGFTLDWVGGKDYRILIAYDPNLDCEKTFYGQPVTLREWGGHRWYFSVPPEVEVQPASNWLSDSNGYMSDSAPSVKSEMLYPWHWNFDGYDIVCQIAPPRSASSCNSHEKTVEIFSPVLNSGHTFLKVGKDEIPLQKELRVETGIWHQIIHRGNGYSVQLLKMMGPVRFPRRDDHGFCEKPIDALT